MASAMGCRKALSVSIAPNPPQVTTMPTPAMTLPTTAIVFHPTIRL